MEETVGRPVSWYGTKRGKEEINRMSRKYMKAVNKSEGFDVSDLPLPNRYCGLLENICEEEGCSRLPFLYAKMGLHRYNLLHGKNLDLSSVTKYNESTGSAASTYYITLEAKDPSIEDESLLTFQTKVSELEYGKLVLSCSIARPQGETNRRSKIGEISDHKPLMKPFFLVDAMPDWPPQNPFEDSKRCKVLKETEVQENNEWIRLYLELAVATTNRHTANNHDLSNLEILKVAIDDTSAQDLEVAIDPKFAAIVYITYKDSCEARVGQDVDRVAIVRRFFYQRGGSFCLVGQNMSSDIVIPNKGIKKKDISMDSRALERKAFFDSFKPAKPDEEDSDSHDEL